MAIEIPLFLTPKVYPAKQLRQLMKDLFRQGVVNLSTDLAVTPSGGARGLTIAPGVGYVWGDQATDQGAYRVVNNSSMSLVLGAAATYPRIDKIGVIVYDGDYAGASHGGDLIAIPGIETSGADLTNLLGVRSDDFLPNVLVLATVLVTPGMGAVPGASIVDRRAGALNSGAIDGLVDGRTTSLHGPTRIVQGSGWTASRISAGFFHVAFNTPFAASPRVLAQATVGQAAPALAYVANVDPDGFQCNLFIPGGSLLDNDFYFEAKPFT